MFKGGTEKDLPAAMKKRFKTVRPAKPPASCKESAETTIVALGVKEVRDGPGGLGNGWFVCMMARQLGLSEGYEAA